MTGQSPSGPQETQGAAPRRPALLDIVLLDQLRKTVVSVTEPWWRGERVSENGLIYGANIAGSRPPLFWCFQGYEEFANFSRALGPDQPLYGMRSGHMVVAASSEIYLHLALAYAAEIRSLGLPGPLLLGGNCQGALLAQKMAEILTVAGDPVSLLVSLNPFLFAPYAGRTAIIVGQHDVTNPLTRFHDADAVLRANLPQSTVDTLPYEHGKLFSGRILGLIGDVVRRRMDEALDAYPGGFPIWSVRAELSAPATMTAAAGSLFDVTVTLRNTSDITWAPTSRSGFSIGNHWRDAHGNAVQWLDGRQPLDRALRPGDAVDMSLLVRAPGRAGDYRLEIDVEHAGVMWLSEVGVQPAVCRVAVSPAG